MIIGFKRIVFVVFFVSLLGHGSTSIAGTAGSKTKSSNKTNKNESKKGKNNKVVSVKPTNMPDFPNEDEKQYQKLFDDTFTNVVDKDFIIGEENDIFISPKTANKYNKQYINGNNDILTQIDVIDAEKKTQENGNSIDKDKVNTTRTRVAAYLTLNQMLLDDMFDNKIDAYYVDFVYNKLKEKKQSK